MIAEASRIRWTCFEARVTACHWFSPTTSDTKTPCLSGIFHELSLVSLMSLVQQYLIFGICEIWGTSRLQRFFIVFTHIYCVRQ